MRESMGLLIQAVDSFGYLSDDFGLDLVSYEYNRKSAGNFKMLFENRDIRLSLTLEKGQLYIHVASALYPDEWHSMLRLVRYIVRKGGNLTHDEQDTDYWRQGMKLESQFDIGAKQVAKTLGLIMRLFSETDLELTRLEMKNYGRPQPQENKVPEKQ